jgi:hypothetical protein
VRALCAKAREILIEESNVQQVDSPVTVCIIHAICYVIIMVCKSLPIPLFVGVWRHSRTILRPQRTLQSWG